MRNNFAPINRTPGAILSLIPSYWDKSDVDSNLVALTHVCRHLRATFISRPRLWTRLDFTSVGKTNTHIKRSRSLPLEAILCNTNDKPCLQDAFLLAIPHIERFKSLTINGSSDLQGLIKHLTPPAPLLEELKINITRKPTVLSSKLFDGNLPSLRTLCLGGVVTDLPWKNMQNLTTLELRCARGARIIMTRLLDFLENAPFLRKITLHYSLLDSSDARGRVVSLSHLRGVDIVADVGHLNLINHLSIPAGKSLVLNLGFTGKTSPPPIRAPKSSEILKNVSQITAVNLRLDGKVGSARLHGPSGEFYIFCHGKHGVGDTLSLSPGYWVPDTLTYFALERVQRLTVTEYRPSTPTEIDVIPYIILRHMEGIHTLTLTRCNSILFILALDADLLPSERPVCPKLKELVLYVQTRDSFYLAQLAQMAKGRASKNMKLSSITIVGLGELVPGEEVFKLEEHVTRVEYRVERNPPEWDNIPDVSVGREV